MSEKKSAHMPTMLKTVVLTAVLAFVWGCMQPPVASTEEMAQDAGHTLSADEQALMAAQAAAELQDTDCIKCHDSQPRDIMLHGTKHKTEIGCQACHLEHLPLGQDTIPQCSMCHDSSERAHFGLDNCLSCHRNPHTPLDVTVDDTPVFAKGCLTCHGDKGEEFAALPSKHSEQNCTFCHPTKHKQIHKCFECHGKDEYHGGNGAFLTFENCLGCHKPHSPLDITYADDTPSKFCGTCHGELYESLSANKSKHNALNCAYCHKTRHPTVPNCRDCHAQPHSAQLLTSFNEDCLKCHRNPHDLIY